ncbi:hypothetical protein IMCC12053_1152 [Celeribacter marinus]|uniref:Uncharacterized protein n=2 Tax=Celeribacter marinus TaxID=1397108 RepID=A0A0P0A989_9RHOB|nr:hypothetical protein IMCC12053_1152 [Celeribacter marinus]
MGHHITLYSYEPIPNVPTGVHVGNAEDIYPSTPMLRHARTGSPAIHADMWRLNLLKKTDKIWVDADMYCYRPFDDPSGFVFGWEKRGLVCNAVLGLPRDSATLAALIGFFKDEYAIAPWLKPWQQRELEAERDAGRPVHMTAQNWGFTGPASVTYFLQQTGEIKYARSEAAFYPVSYPDRNHMIISRFDVEERFTDETRGVHFWARRMKPRLEEKENNRPRRGSFMDRLLDKHEIDPEAALILPKAVKSIEQPALTDANFRATVGLAALRSDASMDKLSRDFLVDKQFIKDCRDIILSNAAQLFDERK